MLNLLFSPQGRINRATWWIVGICVNVASAFLGLIVGFFYGFFFALQSGDGAFTAQQELQLTIISLTLSLPFYWCSIVLGIKRYHDISKSGWWLFIVLIPLVGIIWQLIDLGFKKGHDTNDYGSRPPDGISFASGSSDGSPSSAEHPAVIAKPAKSSLRTNEPREHFGLRGVN